MGGRCPSGARGGFSSTTDDGRELGGVLITPGDAKPVVSLGRNTSGISGLRSGASLGGTLRTLPSSVSERSPSEPLKRLPSEPLVSLSLEKRVRLSRVDGAECVVSEAAGWMGLKVWDGEEGRGDG